MRRGNGVRNNTGVCCRLVEEAKKERNDSKATLHFQRKPSQREDCLGLFVSVIKGVYSVWRDYCCSCVSFFFLCERCEYYLWDFRFVWLRWFPRLIQRQSPDLWKL